MLLVACAIIACMVGIIGRSFDSSPPEREFHGEREFEKQVIRQAIARRAVADAEYLAKKKRLDGELRAIREQFAAWREVDAIAVPEEHRKACPYAFRDSSD
jgi:hypothetical protein